MNTRLLAIAPTSHPSTCAAPLRCASTPEACGRRPSRRRRPTPPELARCSGASLSSTCATAQRSASWTDEQSAPSHPCGRRRPPHVSHHPVRRPGRRATVGQGDRGPRGRRMVRSGQRRLAGERVTGHARRRPPGTAAAGLPPAGAGRRRAALHATAPTRWAGCSAPTSTSRRPPSAPAARPSRLPPWSRGVHERVSGTAPDGRPYSAQDPRLLLWVHIGLTDSMLVAYQRFGRGTVDADQYVAEMAQLARALGVEDPPTTVGRARRGVRLVPGRGRRWPGRQGGRPLPALPRTRAAGRRVGALRGADPRSDRPAARTGRTTPLGTLAAAVAAVDSASGHCGPARHVFGSAPGRAGDRARRAVDLRLPAASVSQPVDVALSLAGGLDDDQARLGHLLHRVGRALAGVPGVTDAAVRHLVGAPGGYLVDQDATEVERAYRLERRRDVCVKMAACSP